MSGVFLQFLRALSQAVQGYLYSQPLPFDEITELLRTQA